MLLLLPQLVLALISWMPQSSSTLSSNNPPVIELHPDISLPSQCVLYGVPQLFRVVKLQPATVYDIKVSYPATQPSKFTLQVEGVLLPVPFHDNVGDTYNNIARNLVKKQTMIPPGHRVLNTAKLRLHPNEVEGHESVRYRLEPSLETAVEVDFSLLAKVEGVQRPDSKLDMEKCVFDIVVEEVLLEMFPRHTVVLIGWLFVLLFVSGKWVLPYLEKKIALTCVEDRVELTQTKKF
ncbi:hypothetical protein DD237_000791 [Peronospora effusa]|uniref:Transmembrane protein 231 n=1 Tax=Peronospora effusa TaxID=542832 RepID=A0A3R7XQY3_9STRA|nr:hypothetical protein DD237_000791 [Peronospora effusa]